MAFLVSDLLSRIVSRVSECFAPVVLFTGGTSSQQIKMWDVRGHSVVYELATGNNEVTALGWDSGRSRLYAATECSYMDRMGYNHDYRRAKMPKGDGGDDDDDDEDEDEDDDYLEGDEKMWPERAYHGEDYFGYMFDAGDHRVCKCCSIFKCTIDLTRHISRRIRI